MTFPPASTDRVLRIYTALAQYPILRVRIRARMRKELFERGVIDPQQFEKEVRDPRKRLQALVQYHFELMNNPDDEIHTILYEWRFLAPDALKRLTSLRDRYERVWSNVIEDLVTQNALRPEIDPKIFRLSLLGALNWSPQWHQTRGRKSSARVAESIYQIFNQAIKSDTAAQPAE